MDRIIADSYIKGEKRIWGDDPKDVFNQRVLAVNAMYGWLYREGILRNVSFEIRDYEEVVHFAFDTKDLAPYRDAMEQSGLKEATLAVQHIFDEPYTPCMYSGAIELGWTMATYRDVDGCVGRSWECGLIQGLNTSAISNVRSVLDEEGTKAAVQATFKLLAFEPDLFEQAFDYYSTIDQSMHQNREYLDGHADKLIYCFQNNEHLDLIDVDCWVRYEDLLDEKISHDEYCVLSGSFEEDPHDIDAADKEHIARLRAVIDGFRHENEKAKGCKAECLDNLISAANGHETKPSVGKDRPSKRPAREDWLPF